MRPRRIISLRRIMLTVASLSRGALQLCSLPRLDLQLYTLKQIPTHSAYRADEIFWKLVDVFDMTANRATPRERTTCRRVRFFFLRRSIFIETRCLRRCFASFDLMIIGIGHRFFAPKRCSISNRANKKHMGSQIDLLFNLYRKASTNPLGNIRDTLRGRFGRKTLKLIGISA